MSDRHGNIGFEKDLKDGRPLSEISQSTFAANRIRIDRQVVAEKLPPSTREVTIDGQAGWRYELTDELRQHYVMWLFFDGRQYQVALVEPVAEEVNTQHDKHLFSDGYLCLGPQGGMPSLEAAFAKSVLWANGYSLYLQTGIFPFSINNQPRSTA